jgi:TRAP-type mannitol/chloroaromatic compound transport system substrate-binding protein
MLKGGSQMSKHTTSTVSRRKFIGGAAVAGAATIAMPQVSRAQTVTLKVQSSWGPKDIFQDMAHQYAERVTAMAGGRLKLDLLPAGAVVKAFQVQDAAHKGVIDGAHTVCAYWYGKNKAASLFGTGPVFGADASQMLAWIYSKEGKALYRELVQDILKLNLVGFFAMPMPTQPLGWFKEQIKTADQMKGLKYRTVGLATDIMQGAKSCRLWSAASSTRSSSTTRPRTASSARRTCARST